MNAIRLLLVIIITSLSSVDVAANPWYLVESQCSSSESLLDKDTQVYIFTSVVEGRQDLSKDDARFSFSRLVGEQLSGKYCYKAEIETTDSSASNAGNSKEEAEETMMKYVRSELAKKQAWSHFVVVDYDAMSAKLKMREELVVTEEIEKKKEVSAKQGAEHKAESNKKNSKEDKHRQFCLAEIAAEHHPCSCAKYDKIKGGVCSK